MGRDEELPQNKTVLRRLELYRDRWSSYDTNTGIMSLSDKLTPADLKKYDLFKEYKDKFLETISPDLSLAAWRKDSYLFEEGSYIDLAFYIVSGSVEVSLSAQQAAAPESTGQTKGKKGGSGNTTDYSAIQATVRGDLNALKTSFSSSNRIRFLSSTDFDLAKGSTMTLGPGEIFGEIGALSGWPQSVTAKTSEDCVFIQIRVPALRLMKRSSKILKKRLDAIYRERSLFPQLRSTPLFRFCDDVFLENLQKDLELVSLRPDEVVTRQGDAVDAFYLVRSGFVKIMQRFGEGEIVVSYLSKGMTWGELELLLDGYDSWSATALSMEYAELVKFPAEIFPILLQKSPELEKELWQSARNRIKEAGFRKRSMGKVGFQGAVTDTGLVQGSHVLVIDLDTCTRCDDCVRACAATHGGRPRFIREGNKHEHLLVAKSCYHCKDPVCLVGCPTGAIQRAGIGEVVAIDEDICIGCKTCAQNCPYDAIVMHETGEVWPEDTIPSGLRGMSKWVASKCDLCYSTGHEPACVTGCPQGCASRIGSLEEFQELLFQQD